MRATVLLLVVSWCMVLSVKAAKEKKVIVVWSEEIPKVPTKPRSSKTTKSGRNVKRRRKFLEIGNHQVRRQQTKHVEPHVLRTDQWELKLKWTNRSFRTVLYNKDTLTQNSTTCMQLEFADNGYVRQIPISQEKNWRGRTVTRQSGSIGKWACSTRGVAWSLTTPDQNGSELLFHGQLLLNPFGKQPKLIRGVILDYSQQSRNWFRPIVSQLRFSFHVLSSI